MVRSPITRLLFPFPLPQSFSPRSSSLSPSPSLYPQPFPFPFPLPAIYPQPFPFPPTNPSPPLLSPLTADTPLPDPCLLPRGPPLIPDQNVSHTGNPRCLGTPQSGEPPAGSRVASQGSLRAGRGRERVGGGGGQGGGRGETRKVGKEGERMGKRGRRPGQNPGRSQHVIPGATTLLIQHVMLLSKVLLWTISIYGGTEVCAQGEEGGEKTKYAHRHLLKQQTRV